MSFKPICSTFFPSVVTGTVVTAIGLSLISVGINSFGGGNNNKDFGSPTNLLIGLAVLIFIIVLKHFAKGIWSAASIANPTDSNKTPRSFPSGSKAPAQIKASIVRRLT